MQNLSFCVYNEVQDKFLKQKIQKSQIFFCEHEFCSFLVLFAKIKTICKKTGIFFSTIKIYKPKTI